MDAHEHDTMTQHGGGNGDGRRGRWRRKRRCTASPAARSVKSSQGHRHRLPACTQSGTIILSIVLAFIFGYALTMRGVIRSGLSFSAAFKVALAADAVSIAVMEIIDNTVIVAVPARWDAQLNDGCSVAP